MTKQLTPLQAMLNKTEKYEGWTNKPTWIVNLWLSNDEPLYRQTRQLVADNKDRDLPKILEEFVGSLLPLAMEANLYADLITWALSYVNWEEIAEAWLEE